MQKNSRSLLPTSQVVSQSQPTDSHFLVPRTWIVRLILLSFAVLGLWYSWVVPPFETPDELYHYAFARHLAMGKGLPVQSPHAPGLWEHEGSQAPLYYLLLGRLIAPLDQTGLEALAVVNPRANLGTPHYPGNKNFMLYSGAPAKGGEIWWALMIGRWFSLTLILSALWLTYRTALLAFGKNSAALAAVCMAAAIPQLAFIGASVSNDAMIILTSVATIYWLCALVYRAQEQTRKPDSGRPLVPLSGWIILGLLAGLATLSKLQGLGLYLPIGAALLLLAWRSGSLRIAAQGGAVVLAMWIVVAGWWYLRNYLLYDDWLATRPLLEIEGLRTEAHSLGEFWGELRGLRYSFWGLFGWFSILFPRWVYHLLDAVTLVAYAALIHLAVSRFFKSGYGLTKSFWSAAKLRQVGDWLAQPRHSVLFLLSIWWATLNAAMFYWLTFAISSQGRLLLPGLSAVAILLTLGLGHASREFYLVWKRRFGVPASSLRPRPIITISSLPVVLLICSLYAVVHLLPSYYNQPAPVATVPESAVPIEKIYGDIIELVAIEKPHHVIEPGSEIEITLYLRKLRQTERDYELFVQLLDHEIKEIANVTTHPGWGRNPTSLWEPGAIYPDTYRLYVHPPENMPELPKAQSPGMPGSGKVRLDARLFIGFRSPEYGLLDVPGYEWDIDSMTVGRIWLNLEPDPPDGL